VRVARRGSSVETRHHDRAYAHATRQVFSPLIVEPQRAAVVRDVVSSIKWYTPMVQLPSTTFGGRGQLRDLRMDQWAAGRRKHEGTTDAVLRSRAAGR